MIERVHKTKDKEPLFAKFGVDKEISSTLDRRVDLPSGGYLVFDYAEAFTVIDVNTGSFVGSRSKSSTQRLEDTIVKNNLEAVKEVVRQLRLRDIGGIVVIDFIDMANPKNRQAVEEAFRTELERDRTKTYVVEISPLGLVEMTRQKVTDGPREVMTRKCPTCAGDGIVVSDATIALQIERRLKALAVAGAGSRVQAYRIALHPKELALLAGPGGERLRALEDATRRRFFLVPAEGHVHADHFEVLAEGRRDDLAPQTSLTEGAEVELKLVEIDLHDGTAAVGKLDGLDVVVADAAKLVGKKAKVTIGRVLEGQAFAALVGGEPGVAPITFESEAEKPTRAPSRRKADEAEAEAAEPEAEATAEPEAEAAETLDAVADEEPEPEEAADGRGRRAEGAREEADPARLARWEAPQEGTRDEPATPIPASCRPSLRPTSEAEPRRGRGGRQPRGGQRARREAGAEAPRAPDPRPGRRCGSRRGARARDGSRGDAPPRRRPPPRPTATVPRRRSGHAAGRAGAGIARRRRRPRRTATAPRPPSSASPTPPRPPPSRSRRTATARRWSRRRARPPLRPPTRRPTRRTRPGTSRCPSGSRTSTAGRDRARATDLRYNPAARGRCPRFPRQKASSMSYAIISVGGKQYRVREGERLLVDRLALDDGASFTPAVLLAGGSGDPQIAPADVVVTATVLSQEKGPKIRIGKYKKRTGYKRHTGFRSSLTRIQIESIGGAGSKGERAKPKQKATPEPAAAPAGAPSALPEGYEGLTVAQIKEAASSWDADAVAAALEYEQAHGKRKGAIAALEAATAEEES